MDNREIKGPHRDGTRLNVMSDKNGLVLALGCMVPQAYRKILREQRGTTTAEQLEKQILVPAELIDWVLSKEFEDDFEKALQECD